MRRQDRPGAVRCAANGGRRAAVCAAVCTAVIVAAGSCMRSPTEDIALGETILEMSDAISLMRQESAQMQSELDSLRTALARQDTLLRRLAGMAGLPTPP